ncbi:hypothetical protein DFH11DRAFT_1768778, partial [Phellopilus nigrolimitatus]
VRRAPLSRRLDFSTSRLRSACEDHAAAAAATTTTSTATATTSPQPVAWVDQDHLALASPVAWKRRRGQSSPARSSTRARSSTSRRLPFTAAANLERRPPDINRVGTSCYKDKMPWEGEARQPRRARLSTSAQSRSSPCPVQLVARALTAGYPCA